MERGLQGGLGRVEAVVVTGSPLGLQGDGVSSSLPAGGSDKQGDTESKDGGEPDVGFQVDPGDRATRKEAEKFGGSQIQLDSKQDLADFINDQCLIDLDLTRASFTWSNRRVGAALIQVRLDWALISIDWLQHYSCSLNSMIRVDSDHYLISFMVEPKGSVKEWWSVQIDGTSIFRIAKKLRFVKEMVKKWNKEIFVDIFLQKSTLQVELNLIWDKILKEGYVGDNFAKESDVLTKCHSIIAREEIFWRQRSRSLWLNDGDRNTRFFHVTTLKHRATNRIDHLVRNGRRIEKEEEISEAIVEFFGELLKADPMLDLDAQGILVDVIPKVLSKDQNRNLAVIPSNEEIKTVVFSFNGDKAPGPDGFPMFFF
ncbi:uncharacterized protein LOC131039491 [Cryptomeria japonica]|uniref:uncharacterized protein LOC131039491 n=1 Tax=Cryptomeria japonica TaxID=3369 RepID=UPI0025AD2E21|nr:uncharacterized protein LOC131039491 [Cryptomeria japonica]